MKVYAISGLGADKRVFDYLDIEHELIAVDWIVPEKKEDIKTYSKRLINEYKINKEIEFGLLGVSFGGLVAIEMSKILNPKFTLLISSVETRNELSWIVRLVGKLKLIELLPKNVFNPPKFIAHYMFGTKRKKLLNSILDDADEMFTKWAVRELLNWKNESKIVNLIKIGGTNDKMLPPKGDHVILVEKGEHFMIVDKGVEISDIINREVKLYL